MRICEIYQSIQGETYLAGNPTTIIRVAGCNLNCSYCDTKYALEYGKEMSIGEILKEVRRLDWKYVMLTGGEPLMQKEALELSRKITDEGFVLSIETNGSYDISALCPGAIIVMDIKTPDSGFSDYNRYENIECLKPEDCVKFVVASQRDFVWAVNIVREYRIDLKTEYIYFSPAAGFVKPNELAIWILEAHLNVKYNPNLHRWIWGNEKGR
ncbi:MAG: radical SAM protein [Deltaproteobacteria bacterium]|nr:radical SAM protein [Deltaproteobacteria bacterium]